MSRSVLPRLLAAALLAVSVSACDLDLLTADGAVVTELTVRNAAIPMPGDTVGCQLVSFDLKLSQSEDHVFRGSAVRNIASQVITTEWLIPARGTGIDVAAPVSLLLQGRAVMAGEGSQPDDRCSASIGRRWAFDGVLRTDPGGRYFVEFADMRELERAGGPLFP